MGLYCALAATFPATILAALFGDRYLAQAATVRAMSVGYVFSALAGGMMMGLVALPRPDRVFAAHVVTLAATVVLVYPLVTRYGVIGGGVGFSLMMATRFLALGLMLRRSTGPLREGSEQDDCR